MEAEALDREFLDEVLSRHQLIERFDRWIQ